MKRRDFLKAALAATVAGSLGNDGGCSDEKIPNLAGFRVVDAHCHIFNASDLPIGGFLKGVILGGIDFPFGPLFELLDFRLRQGAVSYDEEKAFLEDVLRSGHKPDRVPVEKNAEDTYTAFLAHLKTNKPNLYEETVTALREGPPEEERAGGPVSRAAEWISLLTESRYNIFASLTQTFPEVSLFTPAMVDLNLWLDDTIDTPIPKQIELYGLLTRVWEGRMHPLVAFDPLRDALAEMNGGSSPFEWVQDAVLNQGFVGVKLYPPMGFQPLNNTKLDPKEPFATGIEASLLRLYDWCEANDVPIMAHTAARSGSQRGFEERANPRHWGDVLERFPALRLNLAHFGDDRDFVSDKKQSWTWFIGELMETYPHVYADTGFHDIGLVASNSFVGRYFDELGELFSNFPEARGRLMYGSDWEMILLSARNEEYLKRYSTRFNQSFREELPNFMGYNALSFLGLDGSDSGNRSRLLAFYERNDIPFPDWFM